MRTQDFDYLAQFVRGQSGLVLTPDKTYLLEARLAPVARRHNLSGLEDLVQRLRANPNDALGRDVTEAMTTNESFFFRDNKPFDQFKTIMLPALLKARAQQRCLRIWSAASSSGQEAYSLAMLLHERAAELAGWRIEILGTDLSSEMVARAKAGLYSQFEVQRGMPVKLLVTHFKQIQGGWQISDQMRKMVQFRTFNLLGSMATLGQFDVVFCRNVLIYFDPPTKAKVLAGIAGQMAPDGYLVLGGAETILGVTDRFSIVEGHSALFAPVSSMAGVRLRA